MHLGACCGSHGVVYQHAHGHARACGGGSTGTPGAPLVLSGGVSTSAPRALWKLVGGFAVPGGPLPLTGFCC